MASTSPAIARASRRFGRGRFDVIFLAARKVSLVVVRRTGLVFDAAFVSGLREPTGHAMLYLLLEGGVEAGRSPTVRHDAPRALVLAEDDFEGVVGADRMPFLNFGEPYVAIEVRLARDLLVAMEPGAPRGIEVGEAVWAAARRLAAMPADDREVEATGAALVAALVAEGVLVDDDVAWSSVELGTTPDPRTIVPTVLVPNLVESLESLAEVAGVSVRSVARGLELLRTMFRSPFTGWRETTRRLRLKLAVLALSTDDLTLREVARVVGFGSVEAMARAFRDAGAPAPSAIRQALHALRKRVGADATRP